MAIRVYDWQGNERDVAYIKGKYGHFLIKEAAEGDGPAYKIVALREKVSTAATLLVRVRGQDGAPLDGVRVAWYWPDAPLDPEAGPEGGVLPDMQPNRAVNGLTNLNGDVGFGMGAGAYYWPNQDQIGPHATWIYGRTTRSDLIMGLGMVAATNHDHYDVEFALVEESTPTPPPSGECPTAEILAELDRIDQAVQAIRQLLE
jgi:hypothetical protein